MECLGQLLDRNDLVSVSLVDMARYDALVVDLILFSVILSRIQWINASLVRWQPVVDTDLGRIKGSVLISRLGNEFYAFRGIRYAKAPVDELRFEVRLQIFVIESGWKMCFFFVGMIATATS